MKAVLISIQPKGCELIASGKKTIEVRKTRPKLEVPFKCYIYCSLQGSNEFFREVCKGDIAEWNKSGIALKKGKVVGEFICDYIYDTETILLEGADREITMHDFRKMSLLSGKELNEYSKGAFLYGWHISDLVIYDKPRELSEFYRECEEPECEGCTYLRFENTPNSYEGWCEFDEKIPIKRPPQSWCYVEKGSAE